MRAGKGIRQNLLIAALSVTLTVALLEATLRVTTPFIGNVWPSHFDPEIGFVFDPGSEVRWTNGIDFWTRTRANEQGMLDRPLRGPKPPGVCRVLFVGDSFVEAAQVPIADKMQVAIERLARERSDLPPVEAAAVGYSGTGQANQLPLYERIGRAFQPDVVVLVFVKNDFTNNSAVLTSVVNGLHPRHLPRVFFVPGNGPGGFVRQPIDPAWRDEPLPVTDAVSPRARADAVLGRTSYAYAFARARLQWIFPGLAPIEDDAPRMAWIAGLDGLTGVFDGWDRSRFPEPDDVFFAPGPLPPLFAQALDATRAAFVEFTRLAREDGFRLLVLGTHSLRAPSPQVERLRAILDPMGIPYVDQSDFIRAAGGRREEAYFAHDGHWNATGHRWAAEAVLAHIVAEPAPCAPAR